MSFTIRKKSQVHVKTSNTFFIRVGLQKFCRSVILVTFISLTCYPKWDKSIFAFKTLQHCSWVLQC